MYYGCCEPVHTRFAEIEKIPHLRRISVSPWCNEEFMAPRLADGQYVYSRKPNPTLISTAQFDENAIRTDVRRTLTLARKHNCNLEIIMKDVHTLHNEPWRETRWVEIVREEIARIWG